MLTDVCNESLISEYLKSNQSIPLFSGLDLTTMPMSALYEKYKLDTNVRDFVGHAIALYRNDE